MKIKHIVIALFAFGLFGLMVKTGFAGSRGDSWEIAEVTAASGSVVTGACRVRAAFASTETVATPTNYFILINTNATVGVSSYQAFNSTAMQSPPIFFPSSNSWLTNGVQNKVLDYGDDGVYFPSGLYLYKTAASQGEALKVYIQFRK